MDQPDQYLTYVQLLLIFIYRAKNSIKVLNASKYTQHFLFFLNWFLMFFGPLKLILVRQMLNHKRSRFKIIT